MVDEMLDDQVLLEQQEMQDTVTVVAGTAGT